jgi:hypothetical protein
LRSYVGLAAVAVGLTATTGIVGWIIVPERAWVWGLIITVPSLLWAFLEAASTDTSEAADAIRRLHRVMIFTLCVLILADVGFDLAILKGLLGPEWDQIARRIRGLLTGALFAAWGNHLPKVMSPWSARSEPFDWQGVHRFVGRICALAGLALMVVWATLPTARAERAASVVLAVTVVLALGRKFGSVASYSGRNREAAR